MARKSYDLRIRRSTRKRPDILNDGRSDSGLRSGFRSAVEGVEGRVDARGSDVESVRFNGDVVQRIVRSILI